ncbi:MAG: MFS transporter [Hyphomicrobiales bacterium]|nr:MFS transporter [Hyphomicrobiales bacterium]
MSEKHPATTRHKSPWAEIFSGQYLLYTLMLNGGMLLFAINTFVVATVMPSVVKDLGGVGYLTWAFSLFAVGSIIGAAGAGPARDMWGAKQAYAGAGLLLGIGLLGSALASNMPVLVGWRLLQGIGGGALASLSYGLVAAIYPERLRGHVLSTISSTWGIATLGGPGYGALFAEPGVWRAAFWSLVPLTIVFSLLAWRFVGGARDPSRRTRMPWWRLALLALAVLGLSLTSLTTILWHQGLLVLAAIAMTAAAFMRDARAEHSIFPKRVTAIQTELGALYWIFFFVSMMIAFVSTYTTYYLQTLHDVAPLTAGYLFAIQSFLWTGGALLVASQPLARTGTLVIAGLTLLVIASVGIAITVSSGPVAAIAVSIGISGAGIGFLNNPAIQKIIAVAPPHEKQVAGGSVQTIRNIGMSFGAAISGTIAVTAGLVDGASRAAIANAMHWVYGINAAIGVCALTIAILVLRGSRKGH